MKKSISGSSIFLMAEAMALALSNGHRITSEESDEFFEELKKPELVLSEDELEKVRSMSKKDRKAYMKKRKEEFLNEQGKTNAN